jgi:hypothetical protein
VTGIRGALIVGATFGGLSASLRRRRRKAASAEHEVPSGAAVELFLLRILLHHPGVARWQLQVILGGDARLQLAAAFQLGVEFRTEQ